MPELDTIAYLKTEQDVTDDAQDALLALKANVADVRTSAAQDIIDADQNARIESKLASINGVFPDSTGDIEIDADTVGLGSVEPNANVRLAVSGTTAYFTTDGTVPGV